MLMYYNPNYMLFINLNTTKGKGGFRVIIYHVDRDLTYLEPDKKIVLLPSTKVQLILFLSCVLNTYKQNY